MEKGDEKTWSDASILQAIKNPSDQGYEIKITSSEFTFLGVPDQPDFAIVYLTIYPLEMIVELRSLKIYFQQFRNTVISYERLINVIYDDLMSVYKPVRLRIVMVHSARGGIRSRLTIDSDWKIREGNEEFKDWIGQRDEW